MSAKPTLPSGFKLDPGQQTNMDHQNCSAGVDTRKRLYLKGERKVILWYCHNCGEGGAVRRPRASPLHPLIARKVYQDDDPNSYWKAGIHWCEAPVHHQQWLGPTEPERYIPSMGFLRYHPGEDALMMPRYTDPEDVDKVIALQLRYNDGRRAKCKTLCTSELRESGIPLDEICERGSETIIFTEDYLSALKLVALSVTPVLATPLWGTNVNMETLALYNEERLKPEKIRKAIVWLDNDSRTVKKAASKLRRRLELLGLETSIVLELKDPKLCIPEVINNAIKMAFV